MQDPEFQKKVLELCDAALECEPPQRERFLQDACQRDRQLRRAVDTVMRAVDDPDNVLPDWDDDPIRAPGDDIGVYRIIEEIGSGGMGTVYKAERRDAGYTQHVALKVLHTHFRSVEMIARFNEERRILATLNHPYIARLIDGGTTADDLPYLVMELVEGVPIDEYCDARSLSVNDRVWLVQKVAMAIQSAHQNLIVHRDLKPNNILITADGIPKLLDFGIAKYLAPGQETPADPVELPRTDALTPDYASPEQIVGDRVTTASDIYSLGVLTYLLLIGTTPYEISSLRPREMSESIGRMTIPLASARVTADAGSAPMREVASRRSVSPTRLAKLLSGDLDAILAKALDKDPAQRYVSASALARDLERFGKGLTVDARGDSLGYRLSTYVRRNRLGVAAGTATLLALCVAFGISFWQGRIAQKRFDDLHGLAETVIYDLHDAVAGLPGSTPARELITREALHYLDRLSQDASGDRNLQEDLAMAYKRVGDVLGLPSNANLGDSAGALESYTKALAITERLAGGLAADTDIIRTGAIVHEKMADVLAFRGDMATALWHSEQSLTIFKRLASEQPDSARARLSSAISHVKRGDLLGNPSFPNAGDQGGAVQSYRAALTTIEPIATGAEEHPGARRYLALIHERIGTMMALTGTADVAVDHYTTSLKLREQLALANPRQANARRDVGIAYEKIGDAHLQADDAASALVDYRNALSIYRELASADPDNANAMRTLAFGLQNAGEALLANGDRDAALTHYRELLDIRETLVARDPENARFADELRAATARYAALEEGAAPRDD